MEQRIFYQYSTRNDRIGFSDNLLLVINIGLDVCPIRNKLVILLVLESKVPSKSHESIDMSAFFNFILVIFGFEREIQSID
jgi:hypothetical protein